MVSVTASIGGAEVSRHVPVARLNMGERPVLEMNRSDPVQRVAGLFSALGMLFADVEHQLVKSFYRPFGRTSVADLNAAAAKFRDALRMDSEFYSAAFYLGACYAAGGKDRDAAGAWQTSLITESTAPFVYTLLGDALLRLRDMDQALDILTEARALWPNDDEVTKRLGTALAMANKPVEALKVLEPYLAAHPTDHERLFLALRAIYEARAGGRTIKSADEDKALFHTFADAYAAAKGPQQALVDQWRKYIDR